MKLYILLIGIGEYIKLIDSLIESFKLKPKSVDVTFILFTDNPDFIIHNEKNFKVIKIYHQNMGWPLNTLLRYRMIYENKNIFINNQVDKVIFMNANLRLKNSNLFKKLSKNKFIYVQHPGYSGRRFFIPRPFEVSKGKASVALINKLFSTYVQGTLWGGSVDKFITALEWLYKSVECDLTKNIYAKVDDESYLNAYRLKYDSEYEVLNSSFSWPEGWRRGSCDIISVDKRKILGINYLNNLKKKLN